jgi:cobalt/nickel transport system permease protein
MPEWLLKEENYTPPADRDFFINRSILSLLKVLSRIKAQGARTEGRYSVQAVFKVFFTFLLIVLLSLSRSLAFLAVAITYLLFVLSFLPAKEILKVLKICLLATAFSFIILLPAAFWGNYYSMIMIPVKVWATIMAVNLLSCSTRWDYITGALKRFHVPDLFIFVLDITIKYILLLGEFSVEMLYALKLRSVGQNKSKQTALSGIAGTMFLKSHEMAEDLHAAMECRGFTGEYHVSRAFRFRPADLLYILTNLGILFVYFYLSRR